MSLCAADRRWLDDVAIIAAKDPDKLPCNLSTVQTAVRVAVELRAEVEEWQRLFYELADSLAAEVGAEPDPEATDGAISDLSGMWEEADFLGGDPDERSYAEREDR